MLPVVATRSSFSIPDLEQLNRVAERVVRASEERQDAGTAQPALDAWASLWPAATSPSVPLVAPVTGTFRATEPWVFQSHEGESPASIAAQLYGDPALAPLVSFVDGGVRVWPDLLRVDLQEPFREGLEGSVRADLAVLAAAGDAVGEALQEQLVAWSKAPTGSATQAAFERWLAGASDLAGTLDLGRASGNSEGLVRAHQLNVLVRLGGAAHDLEAKTLLSAGIRQALEALENGGSAHDRKATASFLSALDGPLVAEAVTLILSHWDDEVGLTLARFGEATPDGMFHRLFEVMEAEDRLRFADNLLRAGFAKPATLERLVAGRSFAGRWLPGVTGYGTLAAEYWAKESDQGGLLNRGATTIGGMLAATMLPETATQTILTLAGGGIGGLLGLLPTGARALAVGAGFGLSAYASSSSMAEALTGRRSGTGEVLRPEERLSAVLMAASGVLLLGTGAAVAFEAGSVRTLRLDRSGLQRLNEGCVRVEVEGLPPNTEVWVPKESPLAQAQAAVAKEHGVLATSVRGSLEAWVLSAEDQQTVRSLAGSATTHALKPLLFTPAERAQAQAAMQAKVQAHAIDALRLAQAAGRTIRQSAYSANKAATAAAQELADKLREAVVRAGAEEAIELGLCFNEEVLDTATTQAITNYRAGLLAGSARRMAERLGGESEAELLSFMTEEVASGRASVRTHEGKYFWDFADGTVVRYKPQGDPQRPGPTYSIEVKKDPNILDETAGLDGIAFKVDNRGRPVPKDPTDLAHRYAEDSVERRLWIRYAMNAGHPRLRRP